MAKFARVVSNIEKCFNEYAEQKVDIVNFQQIKEWYNDNTKDGITSARLINLLRKRKQFVYNHTERKVGSNETLTYWALNQRPKVFPDPSEGWVVIDIAQ